MNTDTSNSILFYVAVDPINSNLYSLYNLRTDHPILRGVTKIHLEEFLRSNNPSHPILNRFHLDRDLTYCQDDYLMVNRSDSLFNEEGIGYYEDCEGDPRPLDEYGDSSNLPYIIGSLER